MERVKLRRIGLVAGWVVIALLGYVVLYFCLMDTTMPAIIYATREHGGTWKFNSCARFGPSFPEPRPYTIWVTPVSVLNYIFWPVDTVFGNVRRMIESPTQIAIDRQHQENSPPVGQKVK